MAMASCIMSKEENEIEMRKKNEICMKEKWY